MGKGRNALRAKARHLKTADMKDVLGAFEPWLDGAAGFGQAARERLFSPARVFWLFLSQVLSSDGSCREALQKFLAWLALTERKEVSSNTAAYCKARTGFRSQRITVATSRARVGLPRTRRRCT